MEVADGEQVAASPEISGGSKTVVLDTTKVPKRKCSEKQLAALQAAREKAKANRAAMLAAGGPAAIVARANAAASAAAPADAGTGDGAGGTGDGSEAADGRPATKRAKLNDPDIVSAVYTPGADAEPLKGQAKNPAVSATDNLIVRIKRGEKKPLLWFTGDASQIIKLNGKPLVLYP